MSEKVKRFFAGRKLIIASMHGKEKIMGPKLKTALGVYLEVPKNFNSDIFGTFTRDIKRPGDQRDTAHKKLSAALEFS